jgi:trans-aconitate 2-methyltransferase
MGREPPDQGSRVRDAWKPDLYARFAKERRLPFDDLAALVEQEPAMRVVDLGCGTGALTEALHRKLGAATTVGVDRSASMLAKAPEGVPGLTFVHGDAATFEARDLSLVFANASLHFLPEHARLFERLRDMLAPSGQLAVQVPANADAPTHRLSAELAAQPPFASALGGYVQRYGTLTPVAYGRLLHRLGFERQRVRLEVYGHLLPSRDSVLEWVRGTHLTDYEERLPRDLFDRFLGLYRERLAKSLPDERPFYFPFQRILLWGKLPAGRPITT